MRALVHEAGNLQTASSALADSDTAVKESAKQLGNAAAGLGDLAVQLGTLSSQLAETAELLRASDPEGVKRELQRSVDQTERLRSRIDEVSGESRSHLNLIERSLTQGKVIGVAAALLAATAAVLVVVLG